jgi:hypothetical protein
LTKDGCIHPGMHKMNRTHKNATSWVQQLQLLRCLTWVKGQAIEFEYFFLEASVEGLYLWFQSVDGLWLMHRLEFPRKHFKAWSSFPRTLEPPYWDRRKGCQIVATVLPSLSRAGGVEGEFCSISKTESYQERLENYWRVIATRPRTALSHVFVCFPFSAQIAILFP